MSRFRLGYPVHCTPLGSAGGFSGAQFWRIETPERKYFLRRWPAGYPSPEQLGWIHRALAHAVDRGFQLLPLPIEDNTGETVVEDDGFLWELTPELPGKADFRAVPRKERIASAARALAQFHLAMADFPVEPRQGPSPTVPNRLTRLIHWRDGGVAEMLEAIRRGLHPELDARAWAIVHRFLAGADELEPRLRQVAAIQMPFSAAIRDIWCDNVLFREDEVVGIVDFGSMGVDSRAVDVTRLVGSMAKDCPQRWQIGIEAYERVLPLDDGQRTLAATLAKSAALMGGMIWLDWIYVERRDFADTPGVLRRLDDFVSTNHLLEG